MPREGRRDPAKEKFWRAAIEQQANSGLSQERFCRRDGLNPRTFSSWKEIIKERDAEIRDGLPRRRKHWKPKAQKSQRRQQVNSNKQPFVPVISVPHHISAQPLTKVLAEIELAGGVIRIFSGAALADMETLFMALKELVN